jgi:hypothetical protein
MCVNLFGHTAMGAITGHKPWLQSTDYNPWPTFSLGNFHSYLPWLHLLFWGADGPFLIDTGVCCPKLRLGVLLIQVALFDRTRIGFTGFLQVTYVSGALVMLLPILLCFCSLFDW